jgi:hypothetical protein
VIPAFARIGFTINGYNRLAFFNRTNDGPARWDIKCGFECSSKRMVFPTGQYPFQGIAIECRGCGRQWFRDFKFRSLDIDGNGGIKVDPFLKTNDNSIFAAGDIASFPSW